ncbi:hypothetical protein J6590_073007 [Homalodisca vitripennis]|nr:hypothetical protein J6590_073007 [Homalodisca vitripennis]
MSVDVGVPGTVVVAVPAIMMSPQSCRYRCLLKMAVVLKCHEAALYLHNAVVRPSPEVQVRQIHCEFPKDNTRLRSDFVVINRKTLVSPYGSKGSSRMMHNAESFYLVEDQQVLIFEGHLHAAITEGLKPSCDAACMTVHLFILSINPCSHFFTAVELQSLALVYTDKYNLQ